MRKKNANVSRSKKSRVAKIKALHARAGTHGEKAAAAEALKRMGALSKRAQLLADCEAGKLPPVPDFTANTHKPYRAKLAALVDLVKAGDIKGLKAVHIPTYQTSVKAMDRYRNLAVIALEARAKKEAA
jgi:hypothetical protein